MPLPEPNFAQNVKNVNMSLKDITELIGALPPDQQAQSINTIMESIGLMPATPQMPVEPDFITGVGGA